MARKRKLSSKGYTRDKGDIELVRVARERGFLSKQTKLHGGKVVSRRATRKAAKYISEIEMGYKAVPVKRALREQAEQQGFVTVSSRLVVPSTPHTMRRLKAGFLPGVAPVRSGYIEAVRLPYDIMDIRKLIQNPSELDKLKAPGELFAFKFHGHMSYQPFLNMKALLDYLMKYRSLEDAATDDRAENLAELFESIQIFRIQPHDVGKYIQSKDERERLRRGNEEYSRTRRKRKQNYDRKERYATPRYAAYLAKQRTAAKERRAKLSGEAKERYLQQARERKARNYKPKK